jgi:hypothetical protein
VLWSFVKEIPAIAIDLLRMCKLYMLQSPPQKRKKEKKREE